MMPACQELTFEVTVRRAADPESSRRYSAKMLVLPRSFHFRSMPGCRKNMLLVGSYVSPRAEAAPLVVQKVPQPPYRNRPVGLCIMVEPTPPQRQWKSGFEYLNELPEMQGVPPTTNEPRTPVSSVPGS